MTTLDLLMQISIVTRVSAVKVIKYLFSISTLTTSFPLEVIFFDVWTSPLHSIDDFKYYVIFVNHLTKYIWLYPLKWKSHVYDVFVRFKSLVENHFKRKILTLYSDKKGVGYQALSTFLATNGVSHLTSLPQKLEHNGYFEHRHHHIVKTGLSPLPCLHAFVVLVVCFLHCCLLYKSSSNPYSQPSLPI